MNLFDLFVKIGVDDQASSHIANLSQKLGSGLETAAKVGIAAVTAASTAIVAFGKEAASVGANFDKAMSQVAATMGYSVQELNTEGSEAADTFERLRDYAMEMGSKTAFSASQAADALNYMALAGYDADTSISMLPNVLNLAAAGGIELAQASDMVTDAQSALGLSLEDTAKMVDQMAKASSKSNTSVQQLGEAFLTVGGTAKNLKGGTVELAQALGLLADNGVKGSEGGTALRNILLSLTPKSEDAAAAMEQIGLQAYDANGEMRSLKDIFTDMQKAMKNMSTLQRQNILGAIFNKVDLKSVNALLATTEDRWDELSESIEGSWYTLDGLNEAFGSRLGLTATFTDFAESLEHMGISLEDVQTALNQSGGSAEMFVDSLAEAASAGFTMDDILNEMFFDMDELQMAFDATTGAAQAMSDVQLDNLAGDITLFKSALEGAQIIISDQLSPTLREFVQFGSEAISRLTDAFKNGGLNGAMEEFGTVLSEGIAKVVDKAPEIVDAGGKLLTALISGVVDNLPKLKTAAEQIIVKLGEQFGVLAPKLWDGVQELVGEIRRFLLDRENVQTIIDGAGDLIVEAAKSLPGFVKNISRDIYDFFDNFIIELTSPENIDKAVTAAGDIVQVIADGLLTAVWRLSNAVSKVVDNLKTYFTNEENLQKLKDTAKEFISTIGAALSFLASNLFDGAKALIDELGALLTSKERMEELGKTAGEIVGGIAAGLINFASDLIEGALALIGYLVGFFTGENGATDSADYVPAGEGIVTGIGAALEAAWNKILPSLIRVGNKLMEFFDNINWDKTGETIVNGIIDAIARSNANNDANKKKLKEWLKAQFAAIDWSDFGAWLGDIILNAITLGSYGSIKGLIEGVTGGEVPNNTETGNKLDNAILDALTFGNASGVKNLWNAITNAPDEFSATDKAIMNAGERYKEAYDEAMKEIEASENTSAGRNRNVSGTGNITVIQNINASAMSPSEVMQEAKFRLQGALID